jgi:hypothetical protein
MRRSTEGNGDDVQPSPGKFLLQILDRNVVSVQNLWELGHADPNKTGVAHDIENVSERDARKRVPEVRAKRPLDISAASARAAAMTERAVRRFIVGQILQ